MARSNFSLKAKPGERVKIKKAIDVSHEYYIGMSGTVRRVMAVWKGDYEGFATHDPIYEVTVDHQPLLVVFQSIEIERLREEGQK